MKVIVADKMEQHCIDALNNAGCEVVFGPELQGDELCTALAREQGDVLIVRSTKVTEAMFEASDTLALVIRAGAGFNTIDIKAASKRSVFVANCPGKNAVAVAELTFALILALDRRVVDATVDLREGRWNKKLYSKAAGLKGRTLGVVGVGTIGRKVIARAHAFEMPVVAWSRSLDEAAASELGIRRASSIEDVAAQCDVLTIHLAATPQTKHCVGKTVLDQLKDGALVVNTARADVLDYDALAQAMEKKKLRVGLDVFPGEPSGSTGDFADKLVAAGGILYGTHHIGASTQQAQDAIANEVVRIVTTYREAGQVLNCVNIHQPSDKCYLLSVRHRNRPGVLSHTLQLIRKAGVNVEEMENVLCDGAEAACARIRLGNKLDDDVLESIRTGNDNIIGVVLSPAQNRI